MCGILGYNRDFFLKMKSKLTYICCDNNFIWLSQKFNLTVVEKQQPTDVGNADSSDNISQLKWTALVDESTVCKNLNILFSRYWNTFLSQGWKHLPEVDKRRDSLIRTIVSLEKDWQNFRAVHVPEELVFQLKNSSEMDVLFPVKFFG